MTAKYSLVLNAAIDEKVIITCNVIILYNI